MLPGRPAVSLCKGTEDIFPFDAGTPGPRSITEKVSSWSTRSASNWMGDAGGENLMALSIKWYNGEPPLKQLS